MSTQSYLYQVSPLLRQKLCLGHCNTNGRRDLIAELAAHCVKPELTYLHNWRQHDLVMWDDCSTQHKATFDYPASLPRLMHRTTVIGEAASR